MMTLESLTTQATLHRTRLLLGLTDGASVVAWADATLLASASPPAALIEVSLTPSDDLSALRDALLPISEDPESALVVEAVIHHVAHDLVSGRRGVKDTVSVLRQMRRMLPLPAAVDEEFAELIDALMLAEAGIGHSLADAEAAICRWAAAVI